MDYIKIKRNHPNNNEVLQVEIDKLIKDVRINQISGGLSLI
jgi:hypothetical protein